MMLSSQGENTKAFVKPRIREITMELLKIIRETENDDLTTVMQKIVCSYTEELIPVAVQMCLELVQTFSQVLEGRYVYIVKVHIQGLSTRSAPNKMLIRPSKMHF